MKIAVIGAGIGGMSAAYDLNKAGHEVTIIESSKQVGGLAAGFKEPQWEWSIEKFYHHWFASDNHMLGLIEELGLQDKVFFPRPTTVMYYNGKFYPFDSIPAAIMYPGLGWGINKIRFGLVGVYMRLTKNWKALEKTTVVEWMKKWAGEKVYKEMWEPMLIGKFGPHHQEVNMAWFWARMHARTTRLGNYIGGFQAFSDAFADKLREKGVKIELSKPLENIAKEPTGGLQLSYAGQKQHFDQCLVTTSPGLLAKFAPELTEAYLKELLKLKSMGAVVMVLSLKEKFSKEGYYWYNIPKSADFPFLSVVEHTNFVSSEHFNNEHILYIGDYLDQDHEYFTLSKEELVERFVPSLKRLNPDFEPEWINNSWLFSSKYAQPIPLVNHSKNIPTIKTPMDGLYFASMSQVYPWDRGTNFAVQKAREAAKLMLSET